MKRSFPSCTRFWVLFCFGFLIVTPSYPILQANAVGKERFQPQICPTGFINNLVPPGTPGNPGSFLFPLANNGQGSNETSDILVNDYNGDGFADILVGSFKSDEIALFLGGAGGGFTRAVLGQAGGSSNYSLGVSFSGGTAVTASAGVVVSLALVSGYSFTTGLSRVAVAIDYADNAGTLVPAPFGDAVVYLNLNHTGQVVNPLPVSPSNVAGTKFTSNPVSVARGILGATDAPVVGVLCSGACSTPGVTGGFLALDVNVNGSIDQQIGGGTPAGGPVVTESAATQSGSLYDCRSYGNNPVPGQISTNTFLFSAAQANRRAFQILPRNVYPSGLAPRALTFGNSAHRDDGSNDVLFVAQDYGSVGQGASIAVPAPVKSVPEGALFCLVSDLNAPKVQRSVRRLNEAYDFGFGVPGPQGQQDGVISLAGQTPSAVAMRDFNGDNRFDFATAASGSGQVGAGLSGLIPSIRNADGTTAGISINSYPESRTTFYNVGGAPNTVYALDINRDGHFDLFGTNNSSEGGFVLFGGGLGTLQPATLNVATNPENPLGPTRSLAASTGMVIGSDLSQTGNIDFNQPGGLYDIVFSRTASDGNVAVRYDASVTENNQVDFHLLTLAVTGNVIQTLPGTTQSATLATSCLSNGFGQNPQVSATVPSGLSISSLRVNGQTITGQVGVGCNAAVTSHQGTLTINDNGSVSNLSFTVIVNPNPLPTLGTYANITVSPGQSVVVTPTTPPSDNGTVASVSVTASPGYSGSLAINQATGAVSLISMVEGTFTIMVTVTDNCGAVVTRSFTLTTLPFGKAPVVSTISPNLGAIGTSVILTGNNLNSVTIVTFNGVNASFTIDSPTQITAIAPPATTGPVAVGGPSGSTVGPVFTMVRKK